MCLHVEQDRGQDAYASMFTHLHVRASMIVCVQVRVCKCVYAPTCACERAHANLREDIQVRVHVRVLVRAEECACKEMCVRKCAHGNVREDIYALARASGWGQDVAVL